MMVEYLHGTHGCPNLDFFAKMFEGDRVKMPLEGNVTIGLYFCLFPFGQLKGYFGEREQVVFFFFQEGIPPAHAPAC